MSLRNNYGGVSRPTVTSALRASLRDEEKRKESLNGKENDKLKVTRSTRDHERAKMGTNTNDIVVSKPPKPPLSSTAKSNTSTSSKREKSYSKISTSSSEMDRQGQALPSHSKFPSVDKVDEESICLLEKNLGSLSIDDRNTNVMPTPQESTHNESTSSFQADMLISRSLSCNDEQTTESAELERYDETPSPSNLKLTRSLSNEEISSSLQKHSNRSASLLERSGFDAPRSSYSRPCSYQSTSATQEPDLRDNLDFYQGKIKSKPVPGHFIKDMLNWKGDYDTLEWNHQYIQWLFPIPEGRGLNRYAQQLTQYEAEEIKLDDKASKRVLRAYKMMLDFYGMRLADENVGTVTRSVTNWEERYAHLNRSRHNLLRITRIIKSVGELGFERFQFQWVNFLFEECVVNKALPNLNKSCFYHWIDAIHDGAEKEIVYRKMHGLPIKIERTLQDTNSESDEEEDIAASKTRDILEKGATETSYTTKEVPSKTEQKTTTSDDTVPEPLSENRKRLSAHEDFSDREGQKDGENVERRYTDLGDKDDAEDDDIHGASARKKSEEKGIFKVKVSWPCDNLKFYRNEIHSRPSPGFTIDTILQHAGDYYFLDRYPYFIQWLFPIPTQSHLNEEAQPLNQHEAEAIVNDDLAFKRVYRAYVLIVDYYGMQIVDGVFGQLKKSKNWKSRWKELNASLNHEFRRITRILTTLGQLGYERYQVPLIEMLIENGIRSNKDIQGLNWDHVAHWINCIKDEGEKQAMYGKYKQSIFGSSKSEREAKYDEHVGYHCPNIEEYLHYWSTV